MSKENLSKQQSRRSFFKNAAKTVAGSLTGMVLLSPQLISSVASAEERRRGKKEDAGGSGDLALPQVEPGKGMAASMNYQLKHADVKDAALKIERNGVAWDKQFCSSCMLYTTAGKKGSEELGKCSLFQNQLVKSTAWCASWQKKV